MIRAVMPGMRAAFRRICSPDMVRVVLTVGIVAGCVAVAHVLGLTLCPLKRLLGVPCPTCGATRAVVLLLRGDICGAFAMQPLVMVVLVLLAPALAVAGVAVGGFRLKRLLAAWTRRPLFWWVIAVAVLANWCYVVARGN